MAIGEGLESYRDMSRSGIALYVGGMGAKEERRPGFRKYGYEKEAETIQELYPRPEVRSGSRNPIHSMRPRSLALKDR